MQAERESAALNELQAELDADRAALNADKERQEADILQREAMAKENVALWKMKVQGLEFQLAELEASKTAMELELQVGTAPSQTLSCFRCESCSGMTVRRDTGSPCMSMNLAAGREGALPLDPCWCPAQSLCDCPPVGSPDIHLHVHRRMSRRPRRSRGCMRRLQGRFRQS